MATINNLISKIDALATAVGNVVKTKLSKTEATNTYAAKSSLKSLAYKDKLEPSDLTSDTLETLKGEQGPRGFSGVYVGPDPMPDDCNVQIDFGNDETATTETWVFTLADGTQIQKEIIVL